MARHVIVLLSLLALWVAGCESLQRCPGGNCPSDEEVLARAGAVRLTPDQVRARNLGRTEEWIHGGAYYREDGSIRVKWRKVFYEGSWEIEADGTLCYQLPRWQRRCHFYMDKAGDVYLLDEGRNVGVPRTFRGDRLRSLGRNLPLRDDRTS